MTSWDSMNAHFKGKYEREKQMIEERERYVQRMSNHMDKQGSGDLGDLVEEEVGREVQGDNNKTEEEGKEFKGKNESVGSGNYNIMWSQFYW